MLILNNLYTFKEIALDQGWSSYSLTLNSKNRVLYAQKRGIILEETNQKCPQLFKVIADNRSTLLSQTQLRKKYGWLEVSSSAEQFIAYAKLRGVILTQEKKEKSSAMSMYNIVNDDIIHYDWKQYKDTDFEVCKEGLVRNKKTQKILTATTNSGYRYVKDTKINTLYLVHRMILETFSPVENMSSLYVDHINGIRDDNRIENLRWVTPEENTFYRNENWNLMQENFNKVLQKYGYEKFNEILSSLL